MDSFLHDSQIKLILKEIQLNDNIKLHKDKNWDNLITTNLQKLNQFDFDNDHE